MSKHEKIEFNHHKLWVSSSPVLKRFLNARHYNARDEFVINAHEANTVYVKTGQHNKAIDILEEYGVVIITGEPGAGKTTLAEQLCLIYIHKEYELFIIQEDISEAFDVFNRNENQIFYYDDFLGRNYLDAIQKNEDSRIVQFIKSIQRTKHSKFILTSRTNILDQGYRVSQAFSPNRLSNKEFMLNINDYTKYEKALMLYNFMWKSNLGYEYLMEFISQKKYWDVISHANFNPRLVEAISNADNVVFSNSREYIDYVNTSLDNPTYVWGHPYETQCDEFMRRLIDFVALSQGAIKEDDLALAFDNYRKLNAANHKSHLSRSFVDIIKSLTRSFINKHMLPPNGITSAVLSSGVKVNSGDSWYTPFNPSIVDFILERFKSNFVEWAEMTFYYPRNLGLKRVRSLRFSEKGLFQKLSAAIYDMAIDRVQYLNLFFISSLLDLVDDVQKVAILKRVNATGLYFSDDGRLSTDDRDDIIDFCCAFINEIGPSDNIISILTLALNGGCSYSSLESISTIYPLLQSGYAGKTYLPKMNNAFLDRLVDCWERDLLSDFLNDNLVGCTEYWDQYDYNIDKNLLANKMIEYTDSMAINIDHDAALELLSREDLDEAVRSLFSDDGSERSPVHMRTSSSEISPEINALFEGLIKSKNK